MVKLHLADLLYEKRMNQADLVRLTKIRPNTISEIYNETIERITLKHIDLICKALLCSAGDLIEYIPTIKIKDMKNSEEPLAKTTTLN